MKKRNNNTIFLFMKTLLWIFILTALSTADHKDMNYSIHVRDSVTIGGSLTIGETDSSHRPAKILGKDSSDIIKETDYPDSVGLSDSSIHPRIGTIEEGFLPVKSGDTLTKSIVQQISSPTDTTIKVCPGVTFNKTNGLRYLAETTTWDDNNIPISVFAGNNKPQLEQVGGTKFLMPYFSATTTNDISATQEVNHSKALGLTGANDSVYYHLHFAGSTADTGHVRFHFYYRPTYDGQSINGQDSFVVSIVMPAVAYQSQTIYFPGIYTSVLGTRILWALYREPTETQDTYPGKIYSGVFGFHYAIDSDGSNTISSKD